MNEKNFVLYEWNNETKEFWFLGEKIDYIHNPSEWKKYLNDLVSENKELQQKVNQLEISIATKDSELVQLKEELLQLKTNRDEAIELIKYYGIEPEYNDDAILRNILKSFLEILERGKE